MKALVIEDEESMRFLICDILESIGAEVVAVENCQQAFELLKAGESVDIAFVDWRTPLMNGLEFTHAVREELHLQDLPLLMVTGKTEMADVEEALQAGVNEYLMKPFTPDMLKCKVELLGVGI